MFLMFIVWWPTQQLSLSLTTGRVRFQHDTIVGTWPHTARRQMHAHTQACTPNTHIIQCISVKGFVGLVCSWIRDKQLYGRLNKKTRKEEQDFHRDRSAAASMLGQDQCLCTHTRAGTLTKGLCYPWGTDVTAKAGYLKQYTFKTKSWWFGPVRMIVMLKNQPTYASCTSLQWDKHCFFYLNFFF